MSIKVEEPAQGEKLPQDVAQAAVALIRSVINDNAFEGDILSRGTIRASDELRLVLSRYGVGIE